MRALIVSTIVLSLAAAGCSITGHHPKQSSHSVPTMLATPCGTVLSRSHLERLPIGTRLHADDGSILQFSPIAPDNREPYGDVAVALRVEPVVRQLDTFDAIITTAIADERGDLWQVECTVDCHELLQRLVFSPDVLYTMSLFKPGGIAVDDLRPPLSRPITPQFQLAVDDRSRLYRNVLHYLPGGTQLDRVYEEYIFPLDLKYFGIDIQLFEGMTYTRLDGSQYHLDHVFALITPLVEAKSIVTLLPDGQRRLDPRVNILDLGPLVAQGYYLQFRWVGAGVSPPRRADAAAWRAAMIEAGMPEAQIERVLKPNPKVRVVQAPSTH